MGRFTCFFMHNWSKWKSVRRNVAGGGYIILEERVCLKCGKTQVNHIY